MNKTKPETTDIEVDGNTVRFINACAGKAEEKTPKTLDPREERREYVSCERIRKMNEIYATVPVPLMGVKK